MPSSGLLRFLIFLAFAQRQHTSVLYQDHVLKGTRDFLAPLSIAASFCLASVQRALSPFPSSVLLWLVTQSSPLGPWGMSFFSCSSLVLAMDFFRICNTISVYVCVFLKIFLTFASYEVCNRRYLHYCLGTWKAKKKKKKGEREIGDAS